MAELYLVEVATPITAPGLLVVDPRGETGAIYIRPTQKDAADRFHKKLSEARDILREYAQHSEPSANLLADLADEIDEILKL